MPLPLHKRDAERMLWACRWVHTNKNPCKLRDQQACVVGPIRLLQVNDLDRLRRGGEAEEANRTKRSVDEQLIP